MKKKAEITTLPLREGTLHLCLSFASESWEDVSSMQPIRAHGFSLDCGYVLWRGFGKLYITGPALLLCGGNLRY